MSFFLFQGTKFIRVGDEKSQKVNACTWLWASCHLPSQNIHFSAKWEMGKPGFNFQTTSWKIVIIQNLQFILKLPVPFDMESHHLPWINCFMCTYHGSPLRLWNGKSWEIGAVSCFKWVFCMVHGMRKLLDRCCWLNSSIVHSTATHQRVFDPFQSSAKGKLFPSPLLFISNLLLASLHYT